MKIGGVAKEIWGGLKKGEWENRIMVNVKIDNDEIRAQIWLTMEALAYEVRSTGENAHPEL
jgi:hypothetical protein